MTRASACASARPSSRPAAGRVRRRALGPLLRRLADHALVAGPRRTSRGPDGALGWPLPESASAVGLGGDLRAARVDRGRRGPDLSRQFHRPQPRSARDGEPRGGARELVRAALGPGRSRRRPPGGARRGPTRGPLPRARRRHHRLDRREPVRCRPCRPRKPTQLQPYRREPGRSLLRPQHPLPGDARRSPHPAERRRRGHGRAHPRLGAGPLRCAPTGMLRRAPDQAPDSPNTFSFRA